MFGIDDKILSNLFFVSICNLVNFSISIEISLDFLNNNLSFDLDIVFFSFSSFSFFPFTFVLSLRRTFDYLDICQ